MNTEFSNPAAKSSLSDGMGLRRLLNDKRFANAKAPAAG
jgi:hypothetical protein